MGLKMTKKKIIRKNNPKPKVKIGSEYDYMITVKKGSYITVIMFALQILLLLVQNTTTSLLDISVRSFIAGLIIAFMNYWKNKEKI